MIESRLQLALVLALTGGTSAVLRAQPRTPPQGLGFLDARLPLVERFDEDGDGRLGKAERERAREFLSTRRGFPVPPRPDKEPVEIEAEVRPDAGLFDESVVHSLRFRTEEDDWFAELNAFYRSDVEVPATMSIDGRELPAPVGLRFRGRSSFLTVGRSRKRSINISVDFIDDDQRALGERTLNLLNEHADPTCVRELLFQHIAAEFTPAPAAALAAVWVDDEYVGVYTDVEQVSGDFFRRVFGSGAARWKVPGRRPNAGLEWLGPDLDRYRQVYDGRSDPKEDDWRHLVRVAEVLERASADVIEDELEPIFDLHGAIWQIALENVFMDNDGYVAKVSDFALCRDRRHGRLHLLPHDASETFGVSGPEWDGEPILDPFLHEGDRARAVMRRVFETPALRARYVACVRWLVEHWLDWERVGPMVAAYRELARPYRMAEGDSIFTLEDFERGVRDDVKRGYVATVALERFFRERRSFLCTHPELLRSPPTVVRAELGESSRAGYVKVSVVAKGAAVVDVWCGPDRFAPFRRIRLAREADAWTGELPEGDGDRILWYVEARSPGDAATTFAPPATEGGAWERRRL